MPVRKAPAPKPAPKATADPKAGFWGRTPVERARLAKEYEVVPLSDLSPWAGNPRANDAAVPKLMKLIETHGFAGALVATPDGVIRAGHTRFKALQKLGWKTVPVVWKNFPSEGAAEEYALADNKASEWSDWDHQLLGDLFKRRKDIDLSATGFTPGQLRFTVEAGGEVQSLQDKFIIPPFTVLDARQGYWKDRKAAWNRLGLDSEAGRDDMKSTVNKTDDQRYMMRGPKRGGSGFDPVLAELVYRWFCPEGGRVLDPWAGEATKGIVAGHLGYRYVGVELRKEQVEANEAQASKLDTKMKPFWICGDSQEVLRTGHSAPRISYSLGDFDLVFSSPPYYDLEVYSKDDKDGSAVKTYEEFLTWYRDILFRCAERLKDNRFLVLKVGDIRNKHGWYRGFVSDTIRTVVAECGLMFYNEAILVSPLGSLPMRTSVQFAATRKLGKTHQNILVFYKGDPRDIPKHFPKNIECGEVDA